MKYNITNPKFKLFILPLILISIVLIALLVAAIILSVYHRNAKIILVCMVYEIIIFLPSFFFLKNRKDAYTTEQDLITPTAIGPLQLTQLKNYSGQCDSSKPELEIFVQYAAIVTDTVNQNESSKIYSEIVKILSEFGKPNTYSSFILNLPDQSPEIDSVTLFVGYPVDQVFNPKTDFSVIATLPTNKNISFKHEITKPESRSTITGIPPVCKTGYTLQDLAGNVYPTL